jgi:hypothetical protein
MSSGDLGQGERLKVTSWPEREDFGDKLDKLNPDLSLDLERTYHFILAGGSGHPVQQMRRLKAVLMRQYRYGKSHGYEGAMDQIRKGARDR